MSKYILFDVGANWGEDSLGKCNSDPNFQKMLKEYQANNNIRTK